ncbi:ATP-binding protein [Candidatus Parcubacteria bacterium]|nr:MAG: ATP-binding protein [Candidatus Parcubacteria bacterium]
MLIEFRVKNFRSFRDEQVLNLTASRIKDIEEGRVFSVDSSDSSDSSKSRLLKSAVIYGANASGKSNLLKAMAFMRSFVCGSAEGQAGDEIEVEPFRLDKKCADQPSSFEVHFIQAGVRYQYGFSVDRSRVREEWLFAYPLGRPQRWFERTWDDNAGDMEWEFGPNFKGERAKLARMTRENALYLSLGPKFNHPQLTPVFKWFRENLRGIMRLSARESLAHYTAMRCEDDSAFRERALQLLKDADFGIDGLEVERRTFSEDELPQDMPEEIKKSILKRMKGRKFFEVRTIHHMTDDGREVPFDLNEESDGTQNFFALIGPWLDVLNHGYTLFVDELESSMHPLLAKKLVSMFHDPNINTKGAQLVFTTHDTTLLDANLFRRDQVFFTEKDDRKGTHLFSLLEYSPRKNEALQKGYLAGRYGALPYLGDFRF